MNKSRVHYPSFLGFLLFAIVALLLLTLGIVLGLSALFTYLNQGSVDVQTTVYSVTLFFLGNLSGIVSVISLLRVLDMPAASVPVSTSFGIWKIAAGVTGSGLALLAGHLVQDYPSINWLALPLLTIPAAALPIWTITGLGARNLSLGSRWRTWSAFGISLTVTPFILFMLEVIVVILILILVIIYAVANPDVAREFERLSIQFASIDLDSDEAMRLIAPYLTRPGVVILVAVFFSVLVPLMEELIKPLAVWLLAGRLDSAAQGFALGALGGAGFAIVETLNVSGQISEWGSLLFTRIGTGLLHIATSAIMGAAIYMAVRERRPLRLLGTYLLAVLLHGLWNALAIAVSFSSLAVTYAQLDGYAPLQWVSTIGLILLAVVLFTLLVTSNRKLQKTMPVTLPEEAPVTQDGTRL